MILQGISPKEIPDSPDYITGDEMQAIELLVNSGSVGWKAEIVRNYRICHEISSLIRVVQSIGSTKELHKYPSIERMNPILTEISNVEEWLQEERDKHTPVALLELQKNLLEKLEKEKLARENYKAFMGNG